MTKRKRPQKPPERMVDRGPDTLAQRYRTRSEPVTFKGVTVLRKRRTRILDDMHKAGKLSDGYHKAGVQLGNLYELQFTSPERNAVYVDKTPDPSAAAVHQIQRVFDYRALSALIPREYRRVVLHVCCEDRALRDGYARNAREMEQAVEELRKGLAPIVDLLGY